MQNFIEGVSNWKTTLIGVLVFLAALFGDLAPILTNLGTWFSAVGEDIATGNIFAIVTRVVALKGIIAAIALFFARDWTPWDANN